MHVTASARRIVCNRCHGEGHLAGSCLLKEANEDGWTRRRWGARAATLRAPEPAVSEPDVSEALAMLPASVMAPNPAARPSAEEDDEDKSIEMDFADEFTLAGTTVCQL